MYHDVKKVENCWYNRIVKEEKNNEVIINYKEAVDDFGENVGTEERVFKPR